MSSLCVFYTQTTHGPLKVLTVMLKDGQIHAKAEKGHENQLNTILSSPVDMDDHMVTAQQDPQEWFDNLPRQYRSWHFWAQMADRPFSEQEELEFIRLDDETMKEMT